MGRLVSCPNCGGSGLKTKMTPEGDLYYIDDPMCGGTGLAEVRES